MFSIRQRKDFVIHADTNEIQIGGQREKLSPKEMGVLHLLNAHNGKTVSRAELLDTVWGHEFANNQGLTQAISKLRRLFAEHPDLSIRTIPKKGYLFEHVVVESRKSVLGRLKTDPKMVLLIVLLLLVCVLVFVRRIEIRIDKIESDAAKGTVAAF